MNAKEEAWEAYTVARQDFRRACESAIRAEPGSKRAERAALRQAQTRIVLDAATLAYAAAAVAEAREPLVALEWLAQELGTVIEIRSLRLDIIGTKPLPRKYAPDGIAYRLNGRNNREPPKLIPREEAATALSAALAAKETP